MATVSKAIAIKNGTYQAPKRERPEDWAPHFVFCITYNDAPAQDKALISQGDRGVN